MKPRHSIREIFSTFLQISPDYAPTWILDSKLHRSMQVHLSQINQLDISPHYWSLYWYNIWRSNSVSLPREHLTAYLQETCYHAAVKVKQGFTSTQYTLADCFQIAIARTEDILRNFDPNKGYRLSTYAAFAFRTYIKEYLRQTHEVDICSDWSLLRKIGRQQLTEALEYAGYSSRQIAAYLYAWQCFKALYIPDQPSRNRTLNEPDSTTWEAIAKLYNEERHARLQFPSEAIAVEQLKTWLKDCSRRARNYLHPPQISINTPLSTPDSKESTELGEILPPLGSLPPMDELVEQETAQERASMQQQIRTVLASAIAQLDLQQQELLKLYYGQQLAQREIAAATQVRQYNISRYLSRARRSLIEKLAQWCESELHIPLTPDTYRHVSDVLEIWLEEYYRNTDSVEESNL